MASDSSNRRIYGQDIFILRAGPDTLAPPTLRAADYLAIRKNLRFTPIQGKLADHRHIIM